MQFLKSLFSPTLRALCRSLVEMSKQDAVKFGNVTEQIEKTRYAILSLEGNPVNELEQAEFIALRQQKSSLAKEVQRLESRRLFLTQEIEKLQENEN